MIREAVPPEVILPVTVAVPVEIRIWLYLVPPVVVASKAIEAAEKAPLPTFIWWALPPLVPSCCIVTAPVTVNALGLLILIEATLPEVVVVKFIEAQV